MSFDYDLKSNLVAMISNHSQSQSKLQLDKQTGLVTPKKTYLSIIYAKAHNFVVNFSLKFALGNAFIM